MNELRGRVFAAITTILLALAGGRAAEADASPKPAPNGRVAALTYCQQCHALPDPAMLDQDTWRNELLPKMRVLVGLDAPTAERGFLDVPLLIASNAFPAKPVIPEDAFRAAGEYFAAQAPVKLVSAQTPAEIGVGLKHFTTQRVPDRHAPPLTTLLQFDRSAGRIVLGDAGFQGFNLFNGAGRAEANLKLGNIPVSLATTERGFWFACIGSFFPREQPAGQVILMERHGATFERKVILSDLPRLSDIKIADLNGDGRPDFTLCVYGNFIGRFSWFENLGDDRFREHVLFDKPGALRCEIRDIDGDGKADLSVLVAQATESFFIFKGDGRGNFEKHVIWQRPPSWGHSGFEYADFNGDGLPDVLVTNGDNADFSTSPPRPHFGVRIYLNRGHWKFEEAWFHPMNGAYRALARDFDGDGDLDVAAISFFPDYEQSPRESFLYFENQSPREGAKENFKFSASTFPECIAGRWLVMDAADIDGDGDDDILLGSLIKMPTKVPDFLKDSWEKNGPSMIILRNDTRKPAGP